MRENDQVMQALIGGLNGWRNGVCVAYGYFVVEWPIDRKSGCWNISGMVVHWLRAAARLSMLQ